MMLGVAGNALYAGGIVGGEDRVAKVGRTSQKTIISVESQFRRTLNFVTHASEQDALTIQIAPRGQK